MKGNPETTPADISLQDWQDLRNTVLTMQAQLAATQHRLALVEKDLAIVEDKAKNDKIQLIALQSSYHLLQELTVPHLDNALKAAESRIEALEIDKATLETEISELRQIVKNTTTPEARRAIERYYSIKNRA